MRGGATLTFILSACLLVGTSCAQAVVVPPPASDNPKTAGAMQTAVLAGGCFWGVQGVFEHLKGVKRVLSGYSGGERGTAQYQTVGTGKTGHAESVQITYDPAKISYGTLLKVYFAVAHDPTELNRQGPDQGTQYRSSIFYSTPDQKTVAEAYIRQLSDAKIFPRAIVTKVVPLDGFYPAEAYHQDYAVHNPQNPYIVFNDLPKVKVLREKFPSLVRPNAPFGG